METKHDFSFRTEYTGAMAIAKGSEYLCNISNRLFHMVPGEDEYNKEMGLNILARARTPGEDGDRDTEYELEIAKQYSLYTDITVISVIAIYHNKVLIIKIDGVYNNETFSLGLSSNPDVFATQILPKTITGM